MKKIAEEISLVGKCEWITMMELRQTPGEVFDSVALGKIFVVTQYGKPVGVISAPPGATLMTIIESDGSITYGPIT